MPISGDDFDRGERPDFLAEVSTAFLDAHGDQAYDLPDIAKAVCGPIPDVVDRALVYICLKQALNALVQTNRVEHRIIRGIDYYRGKHHTPASTAVATF